MRAIFVIAKVMVKELLRKKDFYVLFMFMLVLLTLFSLQNFFQIEGISRYIKDFGYSLLLFFSFIIAVTFVAKQLPAEIESRTIYPLLSKPVSRLTVVLGKFLGGVSVAAVSFTLFFLVYLVFYLSTGGAKDLILLSQSYLFGLAFLSMVTALAMFFSNILTVSANITLLLMMYFMLNGFSAQLKSIFVTSKGVFAVLSGVLFYLVPHFDFYDLRLRITHNWDALPLWVVLSVVLYTLVYCSFLLYMSGALFRKKRL